MVALPADYFGAEASPVGVVSGSGLNLRSLLDEEAGVVTFSEVLGLPGAAVKGHDGVFRFGHCGEVPLILQSGRIHLYEGHSASAVASTVDALHRFGVRRLLLTNAVGGLASDLPLGALVGATAIKTWPFRHHPFSFSGRPAFRVPGCDAEGTYYWMHGPCYETRAEIAALQRLGGMTVGMSLPLELERCEALGMAGGVVSCVTNDCTQPGVVVTHDEVVRTAKNASTRLAALLRRWLAGLTTAA